MDNITHSLFGAALAEAVWQTRNKKDQENTALRGMFYFVSIFANNFPDLDLLYKFIDPSPLGYLMHHRGFTHTLLWIWPQIALLLACVFIAASLLKKKFTASQWFWTFALAVLGFHVHIGLDALNSYGVHPYVPFDNHWYYGDTLFIMEPLLWAIFVPMLMVCGYTRLLRWIFVIPCLGLLYFGIRMEFLSYIQVLLIILFAILNRRSFARSRQLFRPYMALVMSVVVIFCFYFAGHKAREFITLKTQAQLKGKINDVILSPFPGNPFCWLVFLVESDKINYRIHAGIFRHKAFIGPKYCPLEKMPIAIPLESSPFKKDPHMIWRGFYSHSKSDLQTRLQQSCRMRGWFQFIRAPYIEGNQYSDLRYAIRGGKSFATIEDGADSICPPYGVPWVPPRQDLLTP